MRPRGKQRFSRTGRPQYSMSSAPFYTKPQPKIEMQQEKRSELELLDIKIKDLQTELNYLLWKREHFNELK